MSRFCGWIVMIAVMVSGCGHGDDHAGGDRTSRASQATHSDAGTAAQPVSDGARGEEPTAPRPDSPKAVVIALIEAFRAGDRDRVEALWARDGGTWTDAAGFRERAAYYQRAQFNLDPDAIEVDTSQGTPMVVVHATQDGQAFVWRFLIAEIDGTLRAGGVETYPAGMP